jgi:DNA-binding transcriptional LysR family regulator
MQLQQLRTFVEVYRRRSISEAARVLGLTQPAVSQHVASLESQLGRPLFERHARGVRPTTIADDLSASLGSSLDSAEAALASMRARSSEIGGVVHIAAPSDYMAESVAPRLDPLLKVGLELRLHVGGRDLLFDMLLNGRTDLAFIVSKPDDPRLTFQPLGTERLHACASPAVAQAIMDSADLAAALASTPHLAYDLERPVVRTWLQANRLPLPPTMPVVTAPDLRVLRMMLCNGTGWTVLPDYLCAASVARGGLVIIPPPIATPENRFHLAWTPSALRQPRVALARNLLIEALGQGAGGR